MDIRELGSALLASAKSQFSDYLASHRDTEIFLTTVGLRIDEHVRLLLSPDEAVRAKAQADLDFDRNTFELELDAAMQEAPSEIAAFFKGLLGTLWDFAKQSLPAILAFIPK